MVWLFALLSTFFCFFYVLSHPGLGGNALKNEQTMVDLSLAFLMSPSPSPTLVSECAKKLLFTNG